MLCLLVCIASLCTVFDIFQNCVLVCIACWCIRTVYRIFHNFSLVTLYRVVSEFNRVVNEFIRVVNQFNAIVKVLCS